MLWRGISIEPEWVVLALLVIAVAMGRGRTFLTDWFPFLLLCFLAFVTYLFWPSAPPWWEFSAGRVPPADVVHKILNETVDKLWGKDYIVTPLYTSLNPNQFAAFPSLHAAFPMLGAVYSWNRYRWLAILLICWSLAVIASIVYLGEHYVVDARDGLLYVAVATILVEAFVRWRARSSASKPARPSA